MDRWYCRLLHEAAGLLRWSYRIKLRFDLNSKAETTCGREPYQLQQLNMRQRLLGAFERLSVQCAQDSEQIRIFTRR